MSSYSVKPVGTPGTEEYLGAGAIYYGGSADPENWGTTAPTLLGVTKGGNSFTDNAEFRRREADSDYFPIKGATDFVKMTPQLTVNALTITTANLVKYYAGATLNSGTTYDEIVRDLEIPTASYNDHIWFIGRNRSGDDICVRLDNALGDTPFNFSTNKDEEIVLNVVFTAHADPTTFDYTDASTYPYAIYLEK